MFVRLTVRLIFRVYQTSGDFFAIFDPHTGPKLMPSLRSKEFLGLGSDSALKLLM